MALARFGDGRDWFFDKRFGLFIHWGLYAIPGYHEQHQFRLGVPRRQYAKLMHQFNPERFDPDAWLDLAQEVGMEYLCFTTKHIDGFCLWQTAQTDYNVTRTPYGKDVLGMLADACHRRNFPLCLYYSIADMHQPNYLNAGRNYELPAPEPEDEPNLEKYLAFVKAQVRELCTNYGEIHGFWWDANMLEHRDPSFNQMIRRLQPKAVINNRGFDEGDTRTPERESTYAHEEIHAHISFIRPTEACNSLGVQSWGYRSDEDYYTLHHLIDSIDTILAKGGNYLLNVGPDAQGAIPDKPAAIMRRVGHWYGKVREAFDGCTPASEMLEAPGVYLTRRGTTIYVHFYGSPLAESVVLPPWTELPRRATLLNTGAPVETCVTRLPQFFRRDKNFLRLRNLPLNELANEVAVVRLDFDRLATAAGQRAAGDVVL